MQSLERRRHGVELEGDASVAGAADNVPSAGGGEVGPSGADAQASQQVPSLRVLDCRGGGGWSISQAYANLPAHEEQLRAKAAAAAAAAAAASARLSSRGEPRSASAGPHDGDVATSSMYIGPAQDLAEDDDNTFVDHGSTTAGAGAAAVATTTSKRPVSKPRPPAMMQAAGSPVLTSPSTTPNASPFSSAAHANGRGSGGERPRGSGGATLSLSPSMNTACGTNAGASPASVTITASPSGAVGSSGTSPSPQPQLSSSTTVPPPPQSLPQSGFASAQLQLQAPLRPSTGGTANGTARRGNFSNTNTNGLTTTSSGEGSPLQYSRLSPSEAAPGIVYRATMPSSIRAIAVDPVEPVVWTAVGDDPIAALRFGGRELTHLKSVKDIEQVHCMAVVRLADERATTFKSASASPRRGGAATPKTAKGGRRKKSTGRTGTGARKAGKQRAGSGGSGPGASGSGLLGRSLGSGGDDEAGRHYATDEDEDGCHDGTLTTTTATGSPLAFERQPGVGFSSYLWCGLSRGHIAVVNMANLDYQIIHNAHSQTVNKIWYWPTRNKVWTAGREKGVHVWDPQRRAVLKRRNIAAILTDATYVESTDKVFAVAGDACVRVFEPGGENVVVPKGQENRIRVKADASVIQYHTNSGLVWVGLSRGSVLMNPNTLDVECNLPYTFDAILFEGNNAILAGQESPSGEGRLLVLDVTNARRPAMLAYAKFAGALPLGLHVIPRTRFAVAAQEDPKKGCMMAVFVYDGIVALPHSIATTGSAPPQRTEWVPRGGAPALLNSAASATAAAGMSSPGQSAQAPLTASGPGAEAPGSHAMTTASNAYGANATDRATLHRGAVVKSAADYRTDRKQAVKADRSSLVEAIAPDAQDIKNALKHLVKTADEVRQSLVQQRSAEATLADFSRVLRGRQQWLLEQGGSLANLPVLPPITTDRIDREYVTAEGKTIATTIEQLQQLFHTTRAKLQQLQQQQQQQQQHPNQSISLQMDENGSVPTGLSSAASPPLTSEQRRSSAALSSPLLPGGAGVHDRTQGMGAAESVRLGSVPQLDSSDVLSAGGGVGGGFSPRHSGVSLGASGEAAPPPWAAQLAATLQRERALHAQQLSAMQLQTERLAERNTALSTAFVRLQAHVAALGQQGLATLGEAESLNSTTVGSDGVTSSIVSQHRRHAEHASSRAHSVASSSPLTAQQRATAALFARLSDGQFHKPKYIRRSTDLLVKAMDEVVRLAQNRRAGSGERDTLGGTLVMRTNSALGGGGGAGSGAAGAAAAATAGVGCAGSGDVDGSADTRPPLTQEPRGVGASPSPTSPPVAVPLEASMSLADPDEAVAAASTLSAAAAAATGRGGGAAVELPITSLPGVCALAEVELGNLQDRSAEVASFWARVQPSTSSPPPATSPRAVTADTVTAVEGGLLSPLPSPLAGPSVATAGSALLSHLLTARIMQAICWAECVQTVLRELTHAEGGNNVFSAGSVHNTLMSPRAPGSPGARGRSGPLQVLDYQSAQEQSSVLAKVNHISKSSALELSGMARVREEAAAHHRRERDSSDTVGVVDADFRLRRLPGALRWSHTVLRLLFAFMANAEARLQTSGVGGKADAKKGRAAAPSSAAGTKPKAGTAATRAASAVGVAMTHWSLFLTSLEAELDAIHHAAQLYHAWCCGPPAAAAATPAATPSPSSKGSGGAAGHSRAGRAGSSASASPSKVAASATAAASASASSAAALSVGSATTPDSLGPVAAPLSSKGKLVLLYLQSQLPAATASWHGAAPTSAVVPSSLLVSVAGAPALFIAEGDSDAVMTSAAARMRCGGADSARLLLGTVTLTQQLLHRVRLLLRYAHVIRARALAALEEGTDRAVAHVVASFAATTADADARALTEAEKALLRS